MSAQMDVVPVAMGAFTRTLENAGLIVRLGLMPFGGLYVLLVLIWLLGGGAFLLFIGQVGLGVATALFVAPLYRHYLVNETPPDDMYTVNFGEREKNLIIIFVAYAVISIVMTWLSAASGFLGLLLSLAMIFVFVRLILLPPLTALDNPIDLGVAFSKTEGNFWRILLGGLLIGIPLAIVFLVIGFIGLLGTMADGGLATGPISSIFLVVFQLFGAGLTAAYSVGVYEALAPSSTEAPGVLPPSQPQ